MSKDNDEKKSNKKKRKVVKKNTFSKRRKLEVINSKDDFNKLFGLLFDPINNKEDELKVDYESDGYDDCSEEEQKEILLLFNKKNITIDDLIEWGNLYHAKKKKMCNGINLKTIWRIQSTLLKLKELVGMKTVKKNMVGQILYYLQNLEKDNDDMLHTIIEGPPGVGKTELGKILGELYIKMGIIENNKYNIDDPNFNINNIFKIVKRSDLIGKYLGQTAIKTQEVIDSCKGGVMFIDEAYSLGNKEGRDIYSKECIDTINRNLTEQKSNFLCIIAGYPNDLEKCFFAYNDGLKRRFPFKYTIKKYTASELRDIFKLKVNKLGWVFKNEKSIPLEFFEKNIKSFPNYGGDMETLLLNCKIHHGIRIFGKSADEKKILTYKDIKAGFKDFISIRKVDNEDWNRIRSVLYT
jgi:hypothetical protein